MHLEEGGGAVRDDAVALHLAEAEAAVPRAALDRLPREDLHWPAPSVRREHKRGGRDAQTVEPGSCNKRQ